MTDEAIPFKAGCLACEGILPNMDGVSKYCMPHFNFMKEAIEGASKLFTLPPCGECKEPSKIRMDFYGIEPFQLWFCSTECVRDAW